MGAIAVGPVVVVPKGEIILKPFKKGHKAQRER